jgi:3-oxoacid CoA-transferase subunit B
MEHLSKKGDKKVLERCSLPLTGVGVVDRIISDYGVMDVTPAGLELVEKAPDLTVEQVQAATEPTLIISPELEDVAVD